jgi:hypothetical protein
MKKKRKGQRKRRKRQRKKRTQVGKVYNPAIFVQFIKTSLNVKKITYKNKTLAFASPLISMKSERSISTSGSELRDLLFTMNGTH